MGARRARRFGGARAAAAAVALCAPLFGAAAQAPIVADLSDPFIAIDTSFTGAKVVLFGAVDGPGDVVVAIRGPRRPMVVRRKERVGGVWINGAAAVFDAVPGYYAVAASRPLDDVLPPQVRRDYHIGVDNVVDAAPSDMSGAPVEGPLAAQARAALIARQQADGLYPQAIGDVQFVDPRLFRTDLTFPTNVPTGVYTVEVYLVRDGDVYGQISALRVNKVGLEADIFDFAHRQPALFGLLAVAIALFGGWLPSLASSRP